MQTLSRLKYLQKNCMKLDIHSITAKAAHLKDTQRIAKVGSWG